jgi:hypothetical protein
MHKRSWSRIAILVILLTTAQFAAAGTTIVVDTAASLPPGSQVHIQVGAEYCLLEFTPLTAEERGRGTVSRTAGDESVKFRLVADNAPFVWDFVVPASGVVAPKQFRMTFAKDLVAAPRGMAAEVTFPIKFSISIPSVNGKPPVKMEHTSNASMQIPADGRWIRCLRVEHWQDGKVFVGLTSDCTRNLGNDRRATIKPAKP